jgi:hypothetical protein
MPIRFDAAGDIMFDAAGLIIFDDTDCCVTCIECDGGSGNAPLAFKAEFTGLEDDDCEDCDDYNISYCVPQSSDHHYPCQWLQTSGVPTTCDYPNNTKKILIDVTSSGVDGVVQVEYWLGGATLGTLNRFSFQKVFVGSEPVCDTFASLDIPLTNITLNNPDECDGGTVMVPKITCALTSL